MLYPSSKTLLNWFKYEVSKKLLTHYSQCACTEQSHSYKSNYRKNGDFALLLLDWDLDCSRPIRIMGSIATVAMATYHMASSQVVKFNLLNPNFFSLQTTFSPHMPLTPYFHFCPSSDCKTRPMSISGHNKQSRDFDNTHSLTST